MRTVSSECQINLCSGRSVVRPRCGPSWSRRFQPSWGRGTGAEVAVWRSWATSGSQGRRGVLRHLSLPFSDRGLFNNFSVPDVRKEGAQGTQPRVGPRAGRARGWFRKGTGAAPGALGRRPSGLNACGAAGGPGSTADSALVGGGRLGRGPRAWEGAPAERIPVRRRLSWPLAGRGNRNPAFQESDWGSGHSLGSAGRRDLRNCCGSRGPTGAGRSGGSSGFPDPLVRRGALVGERLWSWVVLPTPGPQVKALESKVPFPSNFVLSGGLAMSLLVSRLHFLVCKWA